MMVGVIPGGGAALLAYRSTLQFRLEEGIDTDKRAACEISQDALAVAFHDCDQCRLC